MSSPGNFPIYSLVNYQASLSNDMVLPGRSLVAAPRLNPEQGTPGADKPLPGHTESAISKPDDSQQDVLEKISPVDETTSDNLSPVMNPTGQAPATPVEAEPESLPTTLRESPVEARQEKNIILIYAESLESLYFDIALFGDLLPNIRTLSVNAHRFTNLVQVGGTGWTIAGIVASQCGFPLKVSTHLASNSSMASVEKPYPDEQCLADILSDRGYQTTYMGGAPLWFAGKENFLRTHGYQSIFGDEELAARLPDKKYQSGWGFYDDSLFKLALGELESLEKEAQPYLLTLLTLDTHHPNGIPSGSCKKLPDNQNSMSNSIYCSDQLIGGFITEAMKTVDMNNTIIVLFSDHLSLRNTLWDKLKENKPHRRLTFMIFDDQPATVSDIRATHFDVAPTILEAAGFTDHLRVGAGISLLSASPGGQVAQKTITTPTLLDPVASAKESGVAISRKELSLRIGDLTLKANYHGQEFVSGMYLVVLDDKGHVMDAIYADDYQRLAKNLNGSFVVGISVMPGPPYSASYFYGFISPDGRGIRQHSFTYDVHLSATDLWPSQD